MTITKADRLRSMADLIDRRAAHGVNAIGRLRAPLYRSVADDLDRLDDFAADNARLRAAIDSAGGISTIRRVAETVRQGDMGTITCSTVADWMDRIADAAEVGP